MYLSQMSSSKPRKRRAPIAGQRQGASRIGPVVRRRRSLANDPLRKVTFQLSESVIESIKKLVGSGVAQSANVFVEDAIRAKLRERRKAKLYAAYERAARDPEFMRDMNADLEAFDITLSDGLSPVR